MRTATFEFSQKWRTTRGVQTVSVASSHDISTFFDQCASGGLLELHGTSRRMLQRHLALIRKFARPTRHDRVLDLGCGTGTHLLALSAEIAEGIGIDLSPKMIEAASKRLNELGLEPRLTFQVDDAQRAGRIGAGSIDLIICIGSLEHMPDKTAALKNAYRLLEHRGRLFLLSPDANFFWYKMIAPRLRFSTKHLSTDHFCSAAELTKLLKDAGFCEIETFPWTFVPRGDMPRVLGLLLEGLALIGQGAGMPSLRGGLGACAWKSKRECPNHAHP